MSAHKQTHGFDLRSRISYAVAAGALAQLVQSLFVFNDIRLPLEMFASHALVVVGFHLIIAIAFGWAGGGALWSAAAFLFPISTALEIQDDSLLWIPILLFLVAAWFWFPRARGAPLIAAVLGASTGAGLLALRNTPGSESLLIFCQATLIAIGLGVTWATTRWIRAHSISALRPAIALKVAVAAWFTALLITIVGGPEKPEPPPDTKVGASAPPPVVLIVLDTLRFDHVGIFGYPRRTTPNLARFAAEPGVLSARSIANAPSSLPTHASMFTGLFPLHHGAHKPTLADESPPAYAYPLRNDVPTLASLLSDAGYWTVGITSNYGPLGPKFGLERGFHSYNVKRAPTSEFKLESPWVPRGWAHDFMRAIWRAVYNFPILSSSDLVFGVSYRRAEDITDLAIDAVDTADDRALFLFLNYYDPHSPYKPKRGLKKSFPGQDPSARSPGLAASTNRAIRRGDRDLTKRERDHVVSLYDSEIAYMDEELGRLLDRLRAHPRYRDMLIIVTSDHGEAFGEHRLLEHSNALYSETLDVPLLVKAPQRLQRAAQALRSGLAQSVDLFPTILEHASVPVPDEIDGQAWGRGRNFALAWVFLHPKLVKAYPNRYKRELQSVQTVNWKLIRSSTGEIELYRLDAPPRERNSVATDFPEKVREFVSILDAYTAYRSDHLPSGEEALPKEVLENLRSLGYIP